MRKTVDHWHGQRRFRSQLSNLPTSPPNLAATWDSLPFSCTAFHWDRRPAGGEGKKNEGWIIITKCYIAGMGMGITQVTLSHLMPSFSLRNKELGVQCPVSYFVLQLSRVWMNSPLSPLSCTHTQFAHEGDIQMIILTAFSSCFFSDRIKMYPDPLNTHPGREPPAPTPTSPCARRVLALEIYQRPRQMPALKDFLP